MTQEDGTVPAQSAQPGLRVLMAGGGTAGHTSPLIATADALRRMRPDARVTALGTSRGIEVRVIPEAGLPLELIPPVPLPRRPGADLVRLPGRLRGAVRATHEVFDRVRPDVVVGFGGYVSVPAYVVAKRRGVPLVAHEGNALPGVANKFASRVCTSHVATSFPDTDLRHARYTGLPIRKLISDTDRDGLRAKARDTFGLDADRPTLLVTGGSQGARRLNEAVGGSARALADAGVQVLHVAGPKGDVQVDPRPGDPPYVVVPYVDRMDLAYSAADAMVCRCGSNTVTEVASLGIPAVFVPLPHGNGEQAFNAKAVVEAGGGLLVDDAALTPTWVAENVPALLTDPDRLAAMGAAAEGLIPRDADERLAEMVLEVAGGGS
jgi:UDP-N-acetylglucosamine--N-acetylmuramyl-(pentapeptide) pyrophosphoryl-undecaprenol N-acetylglucosamine transferase